MPRPIITRSVHGLPPHRLYGPLNTRGNMETIIMSIEEYETVRLIDELNHTQAECATEMGIGRTTAQRIYNSARKKLANCLVNGKILQFEGGDYFIRGQGRGRGMGKGRGQGKNRNITNKNTDNKMEETNVKF